MRDDKFEEINLTAQIFHLSLGLRRGFCSGLDMMVIMSRLEHLQVSSSCLFLASYPKTIRFRHEGTQRLREQIYR
jgi:hypothetical protein